MGLVINPTAFRIGHVKAWTDAWYLHRMHYPVFVHKSLEIKTLLQYVLLHKYPSQWSHWIYSHTTYYYSNNKFYVSLFVYDGNDPHNYVVSAKRHKYGWFKKTRFYRYWTKKQLLDLQFLYQRWYLLCQVMNLDFENLQLDNISWRLNKRQVRKIQGLKKKYGATWTAREELFIWRYPLNVVFRRNKYNKMGIPILNLLYKTYIRPRIQRAFKSKKPERVEIGQNIVRSYKTLYFFFAYIDKILRLVPSYPVGIFNRLTYKACYRFFRMYFVFKPYWTSLCKVYELILLYINVNSKVKIFLLDNIHLNASYIARYIMTCLRLKFDYRDTMIPIKKTLLKIMFGRRWKPIRDFKKKNWLVYLSRYKQLLKDRIHFHLITTDVFKMFIYRFFYLKKLKRKLRLAAMYKRRHFFNFMSLRKNLLLLKKVKSSLFCKKIFLQYNKFKTFGVLNHKRFRIRLNNERRFIAKRIRYLKVWPRKKYLFFHIKRIRRIERYGKKFLKFIRIKRGHIIFLKRKYAKLYKLYLCRIKKFIYLRDLIVSIFFIINYMKKFHVFNLRLTRSSVEVLNRLIFKRFTWKTKKRFLRQKLYNRYKRGHKRIYRTKLRATFKRVEGVTWSHVKRWIYIPKKRKGLFVPPKVLHWRYKQIIFKTPVSPFTRIRNKKGIIITSFYWPLFEYNKLSLRTSKINLLSLNKNKFLFFRKNFKEKVIKVFKKKLFVRGFSNLLFFNKLWSYSQFYKPFIFEISLYRNYINNLMKPQNVKAQFIARKPKKYDLEEMPLKDKFKRLRILESGSRSLLFGYKFHFVGRFTRKQKAASLWFAKGANSVSSMRVDIDYGFYTIALRYSACTLKVWLYRNRGYSFKYGYRLV